MISEYLKIAFLMMRARPIRAALSLLGIFIGVLALVVILSIREGIRHQIDDLFHTEGARVLFVYPGYDASRRKTGQLRRDDVDLLRVTRGVLSATPRSMSETPVQSADTSVQGRVAGADAMFTVVYRIPLIQGRTFLEKEIESKSNVCLISRDTADKLFPLKNPLGSSVMIFGSTFQIIGVLDWNLAVSQRTSFSEVDFLVPHGRMIGMSESFYSMVEVRVDPTMTSRAALDIVKRAVSRGDPQREALYFVRSLEQSVERNRQFNEKILGGLLAIAAISLLVGGIGVANVMVTSVTERTKEIGIRKALGARRVDILAQFTVESCVLCVIGGVAAVLTGSLGVYLVRLNMQLSVPLIVPIAPVCACLALTLFIGVVAGVYPASRAAALLPADALRYE